MRKILLMMTVLVLITTQALSQTRPVSGKVVGPNSEPLPNASVTIKGTSIGTTTKIDGTFSLQAPADATLIITSVGFVDTEVSLANAAVIKLQSAGQDLSEVLVVAYGTAKKSTFTGTTAQIGAKEIENRPLVNINNALTGVAPGIQTTGGDGQPGGGPEIRIRGFGSINASNDPLYVVDGVPYDASIANLNVNDIETISVLKDAASSALYGSRAANGVIMITTKKGKRNSTRFQLGVTQGISNRGLPEYDRVSAFQYYPLMWEAYRNSLAYSGTTPIGDASQEATDEIKDELGYNPFNVADNAIVDVNGNINPAAQLRWADDLDWNDELVRLGSRQDYSMTLSGGAQKTDYFLSLGYTNERGFVIRSDYRRITGRLNINSQPTSWFRTGVNVAGTITRSNQASDGGSTSFVNPFFGTRTIASIYPVYTHDPVTGEYLVDGTGQRYYDLGADRPVYNGRHPIAETKLNENDFKRNILSARAYGEVIFTPWLKFTTNISTDITDNLNATYENKLVGDGAPGGRARRQATKTTSYTFNQLLNFNKKFGKHSVEVLAGHENYDYTYNFLDGFRSGQIVDGVSELANFTTTSTLNSYVDRATIESWLSRINYSFNEKYLLSGSYRRDGNSRFSDKVRWGNFWSVGAGWRIDQENFMNSVDWVNQLKLRGSYGTVGNDNGIGLFPFRALYNLANNAGEPGFLQSSLENAELSWEINKQFDVGVDFGLFSNRLTGTVEYFRRQSDNLLFEVPLPISTGILDIWKNVGSMFNRGIELQLGGDVVRGKDFTWNVNVNWTKFTNEVTKLPEGQSEIISGTKKLMVGKSIYDYWLREWYGVDPSDGSGLYRMDVYSAANTRVISKSGGGVDSVSTTSNNGRYHYNGSAIPDFYGGITNTFRYRSFELSILINYQVGGKIYDATYASLMHPGTYGTALHVDALNRWRNPGEISDIPRMDNAQVGIYNAQSDRWLVDASYLNIRAVNFIYQLPKRLLEKMQAQGGRFFISAENLALISARKGMNVAQSFTGVTSNTYTPARILSAGINVTF
jgi:TonB-linked SusC/RagA family outer membrane protein